MDITEGLSEYLKGFATDVLLGMAVEEKDTNNDIYGVIRDQCYAETDEVFDDAMQEFDMSDVIDNAIELLTQSIKDLLYERTGDECCDEDEIDEEIGKLERQIQRLKELDDQ